MSTLFEFYVYTSSALFSGWLAWYLLGEVLYWGEWTYLYVRTALLNTWVCAAAVYYAEYTDKEEYREMPLERIITQALKLHPRRTKFFSWVFQTFNLDR